MDDKQIVDLYWQRNETAIDETATKYGPYCHSIAYNILDNNADAEESVNDTYHLIDSELLLESLKQTMTGYSELEYDEYNLILE